MAIFLIILETARGQVNIIMFGIHHSFSIRGKDIVQFVNFLFAFSVSYGTCKQLNTVVITCLLFCLGFLTALRSSNSVVDKLGCSGKWSKMCVVNSISSRLLISHIFITNNTFLYIFGRECCSRLLNDRVEGGIFLYLSEEVYFGNHLKYLF